MDGRWSVDEWAWLGSLFIQTFDYCGHFHFCRVFWCRPWRRRTTIDRRMLVWSTVSLFAATFQLQRHLWTRRLELCKLTICVDLWQCKVTLSAAVSVNERLTTAFHWLDLPLGHSASHVTGAMDAQLPARGEPWFRWFQIIPTCNGVSDGRSDGMSHQYANDRNSFSV